MGRRYDHTRPQIREMAFVAARRLAELEGYPGMTARAIAERIGYTAGTLYLVYKNLDELIDRVTTEVLKRQHYALTAAVDGKETDADKFRAVVEAYCTFATDYPKQWMLPFLHERKRTTTVPKEIADLKRKMYEIFANTLKPMLAEHGKEQIDSMTVALWSGICGSTIFLLEQGLPGNRSFEPTELSGHLVALVLGLPHGRISPDES